MGPRFFLVKAEKIDPATSKGNFTKKHEDPPHSNDIPAPNAYMTDKVWNEMSGQCAKGLHNLPIVCHYQDLWMAITLNRFGSHLQGEALKVFTKHKIWIVTKEGDSS